MGETQVGQITSATWSPSFKDNVALSLIQKDYWTAGTQVTVQLPAGDKVKGTVVTLPFDTPNSAVVSGIS